MKNVTFITFILLTLFVVNCLMGCAPGKKIDDPQAVDMSCEQTASPALPVSGQPNILVIGDSISMGYVIPLRSDMPAYNVIHNQCNGRSSSWLDGHIDMYLAQQDHWDIITFNAGSHDADTNWEHVDVGEYKKNMRIVALKIMAATDHPVYITTTKFPKNALRLPKGSDVSYNDAAIEVMSELGIPVFDNYAASLSIQDDYLGGIDGWNMHFTAAGYQYLADQLASYLETIQL